MDNLKNWYENVDFTPSDHRKLDGSDQEPFDPEESLYENISILIRRAESENKTIKAVGSMWSYTDVIYNNQLILETKLLNKVLGYYEGQNSWQTENNIINFTLQQDLLQYTLVETGVTIKELYLSLDKKDSRGLPITPNSSRNRWALPMMGASSGQTIGGLISTGSHGGDFKQPPIADFVRGFYFITTGGQHLWIEPTRTNSFNLTNHENIRAEFPGLTSIVSHDDIFYSILVSVGAVGIITCFLLEVTNQYGLSQRKKKVRWNDIKEHLEHERLTDVTNSGLFGSSFPVNMEHPSELNDNPVNSILQSFELFVSTYRRSDDYYTEMNPDRDCLLVTKSNVETGEYEDLEYGVSGGASVFEDIGSFFDDLGLLIRIEGGGPGTQNNVINELFEVARPNIDKYYPNYIARDTYDGSGDKEPGIGLEIQLPTLGNKHIIFLEKLFKLADEHVRAGYKYRGFLSIRFTKPSKAYLAANAEQNFPNASNVEFLNCSIEVLALKELKGSDIVHTGNMEGESEMLVKAIIHLAKLSSAKFHWGQLHDLNRFDIVREFPQSLPKWRRIKSTISPLGTFSNSFSKRTGLESYYESVAAVTIKHGTNLKDHVFSYDDKGRLQHCIYRDNILEKKWEADMPGVFRSPIEVIQASLLKFELFAISPDGSITHVSLNESGENSNLNGGTFGEILELRGELAAVSIKLNQIHIFAIEANGKMIYHCHFTESSGWVFDTMESPYTTPLLGGVRAVNFQGKIVLCGLYSTEEGNFGIYRITQNDGWKWETLESIDSSSLGFGDCMPKLFDIPTAIRYEEGIELIALGERQTLYSIIIPMSGNEIQSINRISGAFPDKIDLYGPSSMFEETPLLDDTFKSSSRKVSNWFKGNIAPVVHNYGLRIYGKGDNNALLKMTRKNVNDSIWLFESLEPTVQQYSPKNIQDEITSDGNLSKGYYRFSEGARIDFQNIETKAADFECANLKEAKFKGKHRENSRYLSANLEGASFHGSHIHKSDFSHINGFNSSFYGAHGSECNFSMANLQEADFTGSHWRSRSIFRCADCRNAKFIDAEMSEGFHERINLSNSKCKNADFRKSLMSHAKFNGANCEIAKFHHAVLTNADFRNSDCQNAYFTKASLENAQFGRATLHGAHFNHCYGLNSNFSNSKLLRVNFGHANLTGAFFINCNEMQGSDFRNAILRNVDFSGSNLTGTDLGGADLTGIKYDSNTKFPAGFTV